MGKHGEIIYGLASETVALSFLGFNDLEDVKPGEAIYIDAKGKLSRKIIQQDKISPCMFEWVYFSRVESKWENQCVYAARFKLGKILADQLKEKGISADLVIPVPETSRVAAIALAETLDIPFREVLIKNRYINRTFILDDQASRQEAIRRKLFPIGDEIKDKDCLLVDDSIVRGNTSAQIVRLMRQAGASKITIVSTCPPIISPCYYGIDFPSPNELISYNRTAEQVASETGADAVIFQTLDGLKKALGKESLCLGCLTADYPTDITSASDFETRRLEDRALSVQIKNKC
jgi:amidophosphoribosyltransferase